MVDRAFGDKRTLQMGTAAEGYAVDGDDCLGIAYSHVGATVRASETRNCLVGYTYLNKEFMRRTDSLAHS